MSDFKEVTYEVGDEEKTVRLLYKMEVCSRCEGHGTHLTPSIGNHAYSQEEFNETFWEDEDREQYFTRGGIYDVQCEVCHGDKVQEVIQWDHDLMQNPSVLAYKKWLDELAIEHEADERMYRAESGYFE